MVNELKDLLKDLIYQVHDLETDSLTKCSDLLDNITLSLYGSFNGIETRIKEIEEANCPEQDDSPDIESELSDLNAEKNLLSKYQNIVTDAINSIKSLGYNYDISGGWYFEEPTVEQKAPQKTGLVLLSASRQLMRLFLRNNQDIDFEDKGEINDYLKSIKSVDLVAEGYAREDRTELYENIGKPDFEVFYNKPPKFEEWKASQK